MYSKIVKCIVLARFLFGINTYHITHAYAGKRTRIQHPILLCFHLKYNQVFEIQSVKIEYIFHEEPTILFIASIILSWVFPFMRTEFACYLYVQCL